MLYSLFCSLKCFLNARLCINFKIWMYNWGCGHFYLEINSINSSFFEIVWRGKLPLRWNKTQSSFSSRDIFIKKIPPFSFYLIGQNYGGSLIHNGAGDGNRTRVISLEGWCSTIKLHLQRAYYITLSRSKIQ